MRSPGSSAERAFTLLEVMLAVTIFGIVLTTIYGTFSRTLRSKAIAEDRADVTRTGRNAVARMADEMASAFYPEPGPSDRIFRSLPGGTESTPLDSVVFSALSVRPATAAGRDSDQRVVSYFFPESRERMGRPAASDISGQERMGRPAASDISSQQVVDFFAAFGKPPIALPGATPERLLRRESLLLGNTHAIDEAPPTAFLDNVASLRLRFSSGNEWLPGWDSEDRENYRPLPRAVAIDLALYDAAGEIHHFTTSVDLALADSRPGPQRSPGATGPQRTPPGSSAFGGTSGARSKQASAPGSLP